MAKRLFQFALYMRRHYIVFFASTNWIVGTTLSERKENDDRKFAFDCSGGACAWALLWAFCFFGWLRLLFWPKTALYSSIIYRRCAIMMGYTFFTLLFHWLRISAAFIRVTYSVGVHRQMRTYIFFLFIL